MEYSFIFDQKEIINLVLFKMNWNPFNLSWNFYSQWSTEHKLSHAYSSSVYILTIIHSRNYRKVLGVSSIDNVRFSLLISKAKLTLSSLH